MKTVYAAIAASALALAITAGPAMAQSHDWHGGHGGGHVEAFHGHPGAWHGGHPGAWHGGWHDGWHGGRGWGGPVIGFGFGVGVPYGGYAYAPPPVVYADPNVEAYADAQPPVASDGQWYFCPSSNAYYPNVSACAVPWQHGPG